VHLQTRSITDYKCISTLAQLRPLYSHDHRIEVGLQTCLITSSKYIPDEQKLVYSDTAVTDMDRVTRSIYLPDPGVDRHHRISISPYHTIQILNLCFPTFSLSHLVWDLMHPQCQVVVYLITWFRQFSNHISKMYFSPETTHNPPTHSGQPHQCF